MSAPVQTSRNFGPHASPKYPEKPDAQVRTERILIGDEVRFTYLAQPAELHGSTGVVVDWGPMGTKRVELEDGTVLPFMPHEIRRVG